MDKKFVLYAAALFGVTTPIYTKLGNVALGLFAVLMVVYLLKKGQRFSPNLSNVSKMIFGTTIFIIALLLIGLFYTEYVSRAIKLFENYLSYILVPLVFMFAPFDLLQGVREKGTRFFVYGCVISSLVLLGHNFYSYFLAKGEWVIEEDLFGYYYTYHEFASLLKFHPTLLGTYYVFALVILNETKDWLNEYAKFGISCVLVLCILFLNSRAVYLILALYGVYYFIQRGKLLYAKRKGLLAGLIVLLGALMSVGVILVKDTYIYERMTDQLIWELEENKGTLYDDQHTNDSRVSRWEAIYEHAMQKPWMGYGSGSEDEEVLKAYKEDNLQHALESEYGPHNQYLSFLLEYGLIGLGCFVFYLGYQLRLAFLRNDIIYFCLVTAIAISCIFDSVLYLNTNIIFFAFFGNLFTFLSWRNKTTD
ncbi:O-antigen ligase family protein [Myroides odoratus]|uniref:O-antigen ligase family protein n=1 Tax=Myroides odoratus TaxID=256 RepID=UPI0033404A69